MDLQHSQQLVFKGSLVPTPCKLCKRADGVNASLAEQGDTDLYMVATGWRVASTI